MEDLLCFRHCSVENSVFCLSSRPIVTRSVCPICDQVLKGSRFLVPPFRVPSPCFRNAVGSAHCLTIKPSIKSFMEYSDGDDLHVGISDNRGHVHHYDEYGLHCDSDPETTFWTDCLVVPLSVAEQTLPTNGFEECICHDRWTADRYNAVEYNCYDFVVNMVNVASYLERRIWTKDAFCRHILLPNTSRMAKFISIYRRAVGEHFAVT
eukprot:m.7879 g.7879  ORF g.7879 m.7879 type:complete len:208 (+) comp19908_c0_seq1:28-651(+)